MNYHVKLFYMDGKDVSVILRKEDVSKFLACIKTDQPFWDEHHEGAFFSPIRHIRYVQIQAQNMEGAQGEQEPSDIKTDGCESGECEAHSEAPTPAGSN